MYSDKLLVSIPSIDNSVTITKRFVVGAIAKNFDPLGLLLPVTVTGKLFLQNLWKRELAWDETVNEELCTKWHAFVNDIVSLKCNDFPRHVGKFSQPTLLAFADASQQAFGGVAYIVENSVVSLVIAKSRLAPINTP